MPRLSRDRSTRSATSVLSVLAVLGIVLTIGAVRPHPSAATQLTEPSAGATAPAAPAPAVFSTRTTSRARPRALGSGWTPRGRTLLWTNPLRDPHRIAQALARDIGAVPAGGSIKVETYYLGSSITTPALEKAYRRGVHVQIIVTGRHREAYPREARLAKLLGTDRRDGSWLHWSHGSSRGGPSSTVDHDKVWRFSQVGRRHWVTIVGSYNNSNAADDDAYALALSVANREIYDRFQQMWLQSKADKPVRPTTRSFRGSNWDAYWLPGTRLLPHDDPAVRRLRSIPARPSTVMHVRMFAMFGVRGEYVARRLARMARLGSHITFLAGPSVAWPIQQELRAAGVNVQGGCWRDGTFDHAKDMSASWLAHGHRVYKTWVGSDNWTDANYLNADQVELGVGGHGMYRNFDRIFRNIARRANVVPWECRGR